MEAVETVNIHENYMNWGTETRIENLVYLLDDLKKRERNLQRKRKIKRKNQKEWIAIS